VQEWLLSYVLLAVIMSIFYYALYSHFTQLFTAQADVTDIILDHFRNLADEPEVSDIDEGRTHVLGGFVHGDAVCSEDCWCKEEE